MLVVKTGSNAALLYKTAAIKAIEVARVAAFKNGCGNRAAYLSIRAVVARVDLNDDISDFRFLVLRGIGLFTNGAGLRGGTGGIHPSVF